MPLSQAVIDNVAAAAVDYHMNKGKLFYQHIQSKPLLAAMNATKKTFPGGKGSITLNAVFETQSSAQGFNSDDTLLFTNPTVIKRVSFPWKMIHIGITMTKDELLRDGISISSGPTGWPTSEHSGREVTALANILQSKLDDAAEGYAVSMNNMLWKDGTQSSKEFPGIDYFISEDPTVGVVGGIDRATNPLWRNLSLAGTNKIIADPTKGTLISSLRRTVRQLTRYGTPRYKIFCGSTFMDLLESEYQARGVYSQTGFNAGGDIGVGKLSLNGLGTFEYDPTLDALGKADYAYFIDFSKFKLMPIEGEDFKPHEAARPADKMVVFKSWTFAGCLVATQLNTSMVVQAAPAP